MVCALEVARARVLASSNGPLVLEGLHSGVVLAHLLHQRFEGRLLFFPDGLDLGLLRAAQIEIVGEKFEHVVEVAVGATMTVHALRDRGCHGKDHCGSDGENADTSRFHWNSF